MIEAIGRCVMSVPVLLLRYTNNERQSSGGALPQSLPDLANVLLPGVCWNRAAPTPFRLRQGQLVLCGCEQATDLLRMFATSPSLKRRMAWRQQWVLSVF